MKTEPERSVGFGWEKVEKPNPSIRLVSVIEKFWKTEPEPSVGFGLGKFWKTEPEPSVGFGLWKFRKTEPEPSVGFGFEKFLETKDFRLSNRKYFRRIDKQLCTRNLQPRKLPLKWWASADDSTEPERSV